MEAFSVVKFTVAETTPSTLCNALSTLAEQAAQVMPSIFKVVVTISLVNIYNLPYTLYRYI
jgi:hypothetical protein